MEKKAEKLIAQTQYLLYSFLGLKEKYLLTKPMLSNDDIIKKYRSGEKVRGIQYY